MRFFLLESVGKHRHRISRISLVVLGVWCCMGLMIESIAEAKKRRARSSSGLQIFQVTTSPTPFEIGNGKLTFSTIVKVPKNLNGFDILEVTALITSPTQRSMKFLSKRVPLDSNTLAQRGPHLSTVLIWDGKNQSQMFVEPGTYQYEVRAKLMAEKSAGILTRMVSRRSRGTLEVITYNIPEPPLAVEKLQPTSEPSVEAPQSSRGETVPEESVEAAADEVEMLPDESTSHPVPELDTDEAITSEEEKTLPIPQEN